MKLKEKLKEYKERAKICRAYIKYSVGRWFSPRTYVIAYTYKDKHGMPVVDSMVMRAVVPHIASLIAVLQKDLAIQGTDLRVLSFTEAPASLYNGTVLDAAEQLVENADKVAEELKAQPEIKVEATPEPEEEDEDEDVSDMFN